MFRNRDDHPDLGEVGDRIRAERRELSAVQLDQVKQRAMARVRSDG